VREDAKRIGRFISAAYGGRAHYKYPERWRWEYLDNPFWNGDALPIWIAESGGDVVGQACVMATPFQLGPQVLSAGWGTDFIVLPEYRKQGIGRALIEAHTRAADLFLALSFESYTGCRLMGLGFEALDPVASLHKSLDPATRDRSLVVRGGALRSLSRPLAWLGGRLFRQFERPELAFEQVDRFGPEFDLLWQDLSNRFFAAVPRTSAYLSWRFRDQPHVDYRCLTARREGRLVGYCIFRCGEPPESPLGLIADVLADPADEVLLNALLSHTLELMVTRGMGAVFAASGSSDYVCAFTRLGFEVCEHKAPLARARADLACRDDVSGRGWLLSRSDHDWDQYLSLCL